MNPPKISIPRLTEANPRVGEEEARLVEFQQRRAGIEYETAQLVDAANADSVVKAELQEQRIASLMADPKRPVDATLGTNAIQDRINQNRAMLRDLLEVERLQRERINRERIIGSEQVLGAVRSQHEALGADLAAALARVAGLAIAYAQFFDGLEQESIIGRDSLDPLPIVLMFGNPLHDDCTLAQMLRTAFKRGWLPLLDMPSGFRVGS